MQPPDIEEQGDQREITKISSERVFLDPIYHLPTLSLEELRAFTVVENNHFQKAISIGYYECEQTIVRILDTKYIIQSDYDQVAMTAGLSTKKEYKKLVLKEEKIVIANSHQTLLACLEKLASPNKRGDYVVPIVHQDSLPLLLSIFMVYPEFAPMYESYLVHPDKNIEFKGEEINTKTIKRDVQRGPTSEDLRITAQLLIILMFASFPKSRDPEQGSNQIRLFLENRKKTARHSIHALKAEFFLNTQGIENMTGIWSSAPVLKEKMFHWVMKYRSSYPEFQTAAALLVKSSMFVVRYMLDFISMPFPTRAHTLAVIREEISEFIKTVTMLKEEMGDMWVCYRLLQPYGRKLEVSNFVNLSEAALFFCKKFVNKTESFQRAAIPKMSEILELETLATTEDNTIFYVRGQKQELLRESIYEKLSSEIHMAKLLLMDIQQWTSTDHEWEDFLAD